MGGWQTAEMRVPHMFLQAALHVRPHLLQVLLPVAREEGGKGALHEERAGHVSWLDVDCLPVVNIISVPCCIQHTSRAEHLQPHTFNSYL